MPHVPLDMLETLERELRRDAEASRGRLSEVSMLISAKPKGKMRELKKKMNDEHQELSRIEGNLYETRKDIEKARAKAKK